MVTHPAHAIPTWPRLLGFFSTQAVNWAILSSILRSTLGSPHWTCGWRGDPVGWAYGLNGRRTSRGPRCTTYPGEIKELGVYLLGPHESECPVEDDGVQQGAQDLRNLMCKHVESATGRELDDFATAHGATQRVI